MCFLTAERLPSYEISKDDFTLARHAGQRVDVVLLECAYDSQGRLVRSVGASGAEHRYAYDGGNRRFDGGDDRHLAGCGADEAHGGESVLASRGRQAAGRRDEDQHGDQQRSRHDGQDELHPARVGIAGRPLGSGLEAADLGRLDVELGERPTHVELVLVGSSTKGASLRSNFDAGVLRLSPRRAVRNPASKRRACP